MNSSSELKNLFEALAKAQAEMKPAKKSRKFKGVNNDAGYSTIEDLSEAIYPIFSKYGIAIRDHLTITDKGEFALHYRVSHSSGEYEESVCPLLPSNKPDIRGRITETRKYILMGLTGVCGGENEEGAADEYTGESKTEYKVNPDNTDPITDKQRIFLNKMYHEVPDKNIDTLKESLINTFHIKNLGDVKKNQMDAVLATIKQYQSAK